MGREPSVLVFERSGRRTVRIDYDRGFLSRLKPKVS
jgi:hypothetical protein